MPYRIEEYFVQTIRLGAVENLGSLGGRAKGLSEQVLIFYSTFRSLGGGDESHDFGSESSIRYIEGRLTEGFLNHYMLFNTVLAPLYNLRHCRPPLQ